MIDTDRVAVPPVPACSGAEIQIRRAEASDEPAILRLLSDAMGWSNDERYADFFAWKHRDNAFGPSPSWVAVANGKVVGFRTFLRWEFDTPDGPVRAVRAVDTATAPGFRGRGIFRTLTLHGLDRLAAEGVAFVFNTPNDRSRPGYLKMGWEEVGRVPLRMRLGGASAIPRLLRSRVPAERWPVPCEAGIPAPAALDDEAAVVDLVAVQQPPRGLCSRRTPAYLRWRYGFEPLGYRALLGGSRPSDGLVLFRLRRRGPAVEATVGDVLVPGEDPRRRSRLLHKVLACTGADYAVSTPADSAGAGFLPAPGQGPMLTWRAVAESRRPRRGSWRLTLGDIELL